MKKLLLLIMIILVFSISACSTKEKTMQNNDNSNIQMSKENMVNTIKEISLNPRPINSEQIKNVELYIKEIFGNMGYNDIKCQEFKYNDENNEDAIRRSSQPDVYLSPTANETNADGTGYNIIITKTSKEKNAKTLLISAHYDSLGNSYGANDNGSGISIVIELARVLKDIELPYNVQFIFFSGGEKFMLGSRYFVNNLPEEEREKFIGLINIDSVAEKSELGYFVMIHGKKRIEKNEYTEEDLDELAELNNNEISKLFIDNDRFKLKMGTNSDHHPFSLVSIPAVSIVQDWRSGLNVDSSSDIATNIDDNRLIEVAEQVIKVIFEIK